MFYEPPDRDKSLLPHDPLKAIVAPRPIGWISTIASTGVANLAPYSFFNMFSENPWIVGFSSGTLKDSINNIIETGEFVYNLATLALLEQVNQSSVSAPPEVDEFVFAGVEPAPSRKVRPPRVAASPRRGWVATAPPTPSAVPPWRLRTSLAPRPCTSATTAAPARRRSPTP